MNRISVLAPLHLSVFMASSQTRFWLRVEEDKVDTHTLSHHSFTVKHFLPVSRGLACQQLYANRRTLFPGLKCIDLYRVSSPSQHQFIIIIARPTKAETNTHTHTDTHPILYALTYIFTHVKHRPYTHPFVYSQGIFQWAKPGTGYTAAGTSAQCMSIKLPRFLSLSLSVFSFFFFAFISYFPKLW